MKLGKPPVVEVWISVDFDPNENKRQWDLGLVQQYARLCEAEFPRLEALSEQTIQIQETSPTDLPRVIHKDVRLHSVRLWNELRSWMLQLGDDQFSFHVLKSGDDTPGYSKVREAAAPKLEEYVRVFQPSRIRHATLHYLDIRMGVAHVDMRECFNAALSQSTLNLFEPCQETEEN